MNGEVTDRIRMAPFGNNDSSGSDITEERAGPTLLYSPWRDNSTAQVFLPQI